MDGRPLFDAERDLVDAARAVVRDHFDPERHRVGAALRADSGDVYTAVHLETDVGRAAVCAEPVAVGKAVTADEDGIDAIVAVKRAAADETPAVVPPCGICRELLFDYDPTTTVVMPGDATSVAVTVDGLLPGKPY